MTVGHTQRIALMTGIQAAQAAQQQADAIRTQDTTNAIGAIDSAEPTSLAALGSGYDAARTAYGNASSLYDPYVKAGQSALGTYQDSLGLNGATGNANAVSAFQASPGYQWNVDQATDAVARKASALGALGSGNTEAAITDRASNLANQEYGSWQDGLSNLGQLGYNATGAQAGLTKGIGDLDAAQGTAQAGIYSDDATKRAGIYTGDASLGSQAALQTGSTIGNLAGGWMKSAQDTNSNTWNALLNGAKSIASLGGTFLGGGGSLGSLGSSYQDVSKWT